MRAYTDRIGMTLALLLTGGYVGTAHAAEVPAVDGGITIRAGARHDTMRMCVATGADAPIGPAADISLYGELGLTRSLALGYTLPVFRPLLFAGAFGMLQFEPDLALLLRLEGDGTRDWVVGPMLGASLHYGPDSGSSMAEQGPSYFAWGPLMGLYGGIRWLRPERRHELELGLSPYASHLVSEATDGWVMGAMVGLKVAWADGG